MTTTTTVTANIYIVICVYCEHVLVSQGCCNRRPQCGWLKPEAFISHSSGVLEVQYQGLGRCHFLVCRWLASCILIRRGAERDKANSLIIPPSNIITLEVRTPAYEFQGSCKCLVHNRNCYRCFLYIKPFNPANNSVRQLLNYHPCHSILEGKK